MQLTPIPPQGKVVRVECDTMGARAALFFARPEPLSKTGANFALMGEGATERLCLRVVTALFFANTGVKSITPRVYPTSPLGASTKS